MKNQGRLILTLVMVLIVVIFAVLNVTSVPINFAFAKIEGPLIIVILVSLLFGAIITFLVSSSASFSARKNEKALQQKLNAVEADQADQQKNAKATVEKAVATQTADLQDQLMRKDQEIADLKIQISRAEENEGGLPEDSLNG